MAKQSSVSSSSASVYELYRLVFPNGKFYFGISRSTSYRWRQHKRNALGKRLDFPVHNAIRKYGSKHVVVERLVIGRQEYILDLEIAAIRFFKTLNRRYGYNLAPGGDVGAMQNPVVARKVAATKRGRPLSEATNQGWLKWFAENREEHCQKLSSIHKARWRAMDLVERAETISKLVPRGRSAHNKGKKITDPRALANIRAAAANRAPTWLQNITKANQSADFTPARAAQLAAARRNIDYSSPQRGARISAAKMGHEVSTETRDKIRAALLGRSRRR